MQRTTQLENMSTQAEPVPWILRRQYSEPQATHSTRQCLEQRFAFSATSVAISTNQSTESRSMSGLFNMRLPSISSIKNTQPQQALRQGQKKVQRAFHEVASTFDMLSQRLRRSTRRRYRLTNSPFTPSPGSPRRRSRLRASPAARLYSPFGIETPAERAGCANGALEVTPPVPKAPPRRRRVLQNVANTGAAPSPRPKARAPHSGPSPGQRRALGPAWAPPCDGFHSPTGRLRSDAARAERSGRELHRLAETVGRRSFRL
ncbi:hypothetical protein FJT64_007458 [Amphibalanus amphitrite]|uniref:Uncharacterized protein n=1 Tax=Amphibalanus amphitrite TaxID=1232801 RepID=A0A6A4VU14_AMPAM|nr:hypothetical protein FJT64_007458 [Amphibalanus amphitrite]